MKKDDWLRVGGVKGYADGSLGSSTALFFEPYDDDPGNRGVFAAEAIPLSRMEERVAGADAAGLQVEIHAIGDRANAEILDLFERVAAKNGARDRRFRIEHAQHLRASDIPRFARLGVIASMQPYHAVDDGRWAQMRIGRERCKTTYAFRSLLDAKAVLAFGSDWDVAPLSPPGRHLGGRDAPDDRREEPGGLVSRAEDLGRGSAARLHLVRRLRRVRGKREGDTRRREARGLRRPLRRPALRSNRSESRRSLSS